MSTSWSRLKSERFAAMTDFERAEYDRAYVVARFAAEVGERVRGAREAAELSQRELARRVGTSQATVIRLEDGAVGAKLRLFNASRLRLGSRSTSSSALRRRSSSCPRD